MGRKESNQTNKSYADPERFCERGSNFDKIFLVDEWREDPITTISGPSFARQRNAIKLPFAGVPMMAQH